MGKTPIVEVFGPTIQGEGIDQGVPTHFVRTGGCDFKCSWCDTPHAVLPENVRKAGRLSEIKILERILALPQGPEWVTVSGGNPALYDLTHLCALLRARGFQIAVETQGTRYLPWVGGSVDRLCISPKPPSSGMTYTETDLGAFMAKAVRDMGGDKFFNGGAFIKIVVFTEEDYNWAKEVFYAVFEASGGVGLPCFLSAGNDAGATVGNPSRRDTRSIYQARTDLLVKYKWLTEKVMHDKDMGMLGARVQAQSHVLLWGNIQGV